METNDMSKRIQLGLYALLCLCVALAVFFLPMKNRFVLLFIYAILFLIAMLFDHRGMMHSVPAGPYSIQSLGIFLGMLGLLTSMLLGDYLLARNGSNDFFGLMNSAQKLEVFTHHLPLLVLAGLLGALAVFGYLATIRQRNFPRFVWLLMDRAFILFALAGILLPFSSISDGLYASVAPAVTGDPDILNKQVVYETFVMLDTQLQLVHEYALQAWEEMIETRILNDDPAIVYHQVTKFADEQDTRDGVKEAVAVIEKVTENDGSFSLILDFREAFHSNLEYSLAAHRIWAVGFREHEKVKSNADRIAVIGKDAPRFRAEKELMESDRVQYCTDLEAALGWLESQA
jgi:hypothetical protein